MLLVVEGRKTQPSERCLSLKYDGARYQNKSTSMGSNHGSPFCVSVAACSPCSCVGSPRFPPTPPQSRDALGLLEPLDCVSESVSVMSC